MNTKKSIVSSFTVVIYVKLLDEGVDVWRPVFARVIESDKNLFEILPAPNNEVPEGEVWEFDPGSFVYAKESKLSNGVHFVAYEKTNDRD